MWESTKGYETSKWVAMPILVIVLLATPSLLKLSIEYANKDWINPCQALEWCV